MQGGSPGRPWAMGGRRRVLILYGSRRAGQPAAPAPDLARTICLLPQTTPLVGRSSNLLQPLLSRSAILCGTAHPRFRRRRRRRRHIPSPTACRLHRALPTHQNSQKTDTFFGRRLEQHPVAGRCATQRMKSVACSGLQMCRRVVVRGPAAVQIATARPLARSAVSIEAGPVRAMWRGVASVGTRMLSGSAPAASDEGSAAVAEVSGIPPIRFITPTPKPKNMAFDEVPPPPPPLPLPSRPPPSPVFLLGSPLNGGLILTPHGLCDVHRRHWTSAGLAPSGTRRSSSTFASAPTTRT